MEHYKQHSQQPESIIPEEIDRWIDNQISAQGIGLEYFHGIGAKKAAVALYRKMQSEHSIFLTQINTQGEQIAQLLVELAAAEGRSLVVWEPPSVWPVAPDAYFCDVLIPRATDIPRPAKEICRWSGDRWLTNYSDTKILRWAREISADQYNDELQAHQNTIDIQHSELMENKIEMAELEQKAAARQVQIEGLQTALKEAHAMYLKESQGRTAAEKEAADYREALEGMRIDLRYHRIGLCQDIVMNVLDKYPKV